MPGPRGARCLALVAADNAALMMLCLHLNAGPRQPFDFSIFPVVLDCAGCGRGWYLQAGAASRCSAEHCTFGLGVDSSSPGGISRRQMRELGPGLVGRRVGSGQRGPSDRSRQARARG